MSPRHLLLVSTALLMGISLSACRDPAARTQLAEQDDGLTSGATSNDPVVKGAIADQIMVDPAMTGQSNAAAATSGAQPVAGTVPALRGGGTAIEAVADARSSAGQLMRTPAPANFADNCDSNCDNAAVARPATLAGVARQQAGGRCAADIRYGAEWAQRLPAAFPVYPRAALREAAGVANGTCNVRVVNFQSRAGMQAVLDYYYTMAIRNGYEAEHLLRGSEHYLGGTRGDEAYVIMIRDIGGGVVDVDLVASGGN